MAVKSFHFIPKSIIFLLKGLNYFDLYNKDKHLISNYIICPLDGII